MKVKCICGKEDIGRHKKLLKRGWWIYFINNNEKVIRCKKCKPNIIDKIKKLFNKEYIHEAHKEIFNILNKIKTLKKLTPKEELDKIILKKIVKRKTNYKYKRNKNQIFRKMGVKVLA